MTTPDIEMSNENQSENEQASTSLDKTEKLREWPDVVRIGQLILNELELSDTNQTLTRWMAHRIAELLDRADQASDPTMQEVARQECADLVIRLWQQRRTWPDRAPLSGFLSLLARSSSERYSYQGRTKVQDLTWLEALPVMSDLLDDAMDVCRNAAYLQINAQEIRQELERVTPFLDDLDDEEKKMVELLKGINDFVQRNPKIAAMTPVHQAEHFRTRFIAIQKKQAELVSSLNSSVLPLRKALGAEEEIITESEETED